MSVYSIMFVQSAAGLTIPLLLLVIPLDRYDIHQPLFFADYKQDCVCLPARGQASTSMHGEDVTFKEFDADHWLILSHANEVNKKLLAWGLTEDARKSRQ